MELAQDFYRAFEDVVGSENISVDPAIVDGYAFQPMGGARRGVRFFKRPIAVILPGTTKEVQSVVKLCGRFKLKVRAMGTGYGIYNIVGSEDTVQLDLRRMNRIIDIDEKNMIAIVEPYVSFIQVMGEAMKKGLACNVLGAGSQCSMLASYTSLHGNNVMAASQGYSGRNLLGVEWVLPTGEIIQLGAPGSGAGWFTGDGPGPSLRGIMRGAGGAQSGLGVFTKCAAHLHPWPGPAELEVKGVSPYYEAEVPPNFEYHICEFPTWQQYADAMAKMGAAGIVFSMQKTGGPGSVGNCVTGNNNEFYEKRVKGELAVPWKSFAIVMAGYTKEEHDWQVKTFNAILEETGGKIAPVGEDPMFKNSDFLCMTKACFIPRQPFRASGTFGVDGMVGIDTADHMAIGLEADADLYTKHTPSGVMVNDGDLNSWSTVYEGSHYALFECGYAISAINQENLKTYQKMTDEGNDLCYTTPFANNLFHMGELTLKRFGPKCMDYPKWMYKIKKTFDPNTVADPLVYPTGD